MEEPEALNLISTLVPFSLIVFIIAVGVVLLNQQFRKNLYKQQLLQEELKLKQQQELLQVSIQTQEEERKRIASDLHDELGALLSIGRMQMVQLEQKTLEHQEKVQAVRELMEEALSSTRRISHQLMPLQLSTLGLEEALLSLIHKAKDTGKIDAEVVVDRNCQPLSWDIELGLYRVYSELIHNTLKHAEATTLSISMYCESNQLYGRYSDDGKGLDETQITNGLGLKSLRGRVRALNGTIEIGNRKGKGFFAQMKIPLKINSSQS